MTSKPRQRGGQARAKATPADATPDETPAAPTAQDQADAAAEQEKAERDAEAEKAAQEQAASSAEPTPASEQAADEGAGAKDGPSIAEQAAYTEDVLHIDGDPVPDRPARAMVREETGISPEPFVLGSEGEAIATAPTGDDARNGKPLGIGTDTTGTMRTADPAVPTAPTGGDVRNGLPVNMAGQIDTSGELRTREPVAKLVGSGVRGEQGVGTLDPDLPPDERPTYPSTTLTRATPDAAPMEPDDVKRATEPKLGDVQTSTDPIAAAAAIQSHAGDATVDLIDHKTGTSIVPSDFFETIDGPQGRSMMRCNARVVEVYTVRHTKSPGQRILFTEGQLVPVGIAQTLITLHG